MNTIEEDLELRGEDIHYCGTWIGRYDIFLDGTCRIVAFNQRSLLPDSPRMTYAYTDTADMLSTIARYIRQPIIWKEI